MSNDDPASIDNVERERIGNYWRNIATADIPGHQHMADTFHRRKLCVAKKLAEEAQIFVIGTNGFIVIDPAAPKADVQSDLCIPCRDLDPAAFCKVCPITPFFDNTNIATADVLCSYLGGIAAFRAVLGDKSEGEGFMFLVRTCASLIWEEEVVQEEVEEEVVQEVAEEELVQEVAEEEVVQEGAEEEEEMADPLPSQTKSTWMRLVIWQRACLLVIRVNWELGVGGEPRGYFVILVIRLLDYCNKL